MPLALAAGIALQGQDIVRGSRTSIVCRQEPAASWFLSKIYPTDSRVAAACRVILAWRETKPIAFPIQPEITADFRLEVLSQGAFGGDPPAASSCVARAGATLGKASRKECPCCWFVVGSDQ